MSPRLVLAPSRGAPQGKLATCCAAPPDSQRAHATSALVVGLVELGEDAVGMMAMAGKTFLELGLDSGKLLRLAARLSQRLELDISFLDFLFHPTPQKLIEHMDQALCSKLPGIESRDGLKHLRKVDSLGDLSKLASRDVAACSDTSTVADASSPTSSLDKDFDDKHWAGSTPRSGEATSTLAVVLAALAEVGLVLSGDSDEDMECSLFKRGLDSLDAVRVKDRLSEMLDLSLPSTLFFDFATVREVVAELERQRAEHAVPVQSLPCDGEQHGDPVEAGTTDSTSSTVQSDVKLDALSILVATLRGFDISLDVEDDDELDCGFFKLGLDSLDMPTMTDRLSKQLGISLPATLLLDCSTPRQLCEELGNRMKYVQPSPAVTTDSTSSSEDSDNKLDVLSVLVATLRGFDICLDVEDDDELDCGFFKLGLDSLDMPTMTDRLSKELGISLPATLLLDCSTPRQLYEELANRMKDVQPAPAQEKAGQRSAPDSAAVSSGLIGNASARVLTEAQLREKIGSILSDLGYLESSESEESADRKFRDLGLDSLDMTTVTERLSRDLDLRLPATLLFDFSTCQDLAHELRRQLEERFGVAHATPEAAEEPLASKRVALSAAATGTSISGHCPKGISSKNSREKWQQLSATEVIALVARQCYPDMLGYIAAIEPIVAEVEGAVLLKFGLIDSLTADTVKFGREELVIALRKHWQTTPKLQQAFLLMLRLTKQSQNWPMPRNH
eukprot:TRINITY_DN9065_c0_g1_i3.p1 TRINITY_DN9065_c0_g1~~TRINITY_DN9065_c0_g1_i3.p1  ORF type:complete len:733 (-),score=170.29 TRINITY_DN9065_c0_g1_i3:212-2410(-)